MDYHSPNISAPRQAPAAPRQRLTFALFSLAVATQILWSAKLSAQTCNETGGWVVSIEGEVRVSGTPGRMGEQFCTGEELTVGQQSRAAVRLAQTQTVVRMNQNSSLIVETADDGGTLIKMLKGILYLFSRRPQSLTVETPYINAAVDGTEFVIGATAQGSDVTVIEGSVRVSNSQGAVLLNQGELATASGNAQPLRRTTVDPLNAAQWALYYPSIGASENTSDTVRNAALFLARGDVRSAELALAASPIDAPSLALESIIALTRNQTDDAMALANRAVDADAGSALAYSALSFAQQAVFDIDQALSSAETAVQNDTENADAWARLAELQLGVNQTRQALLSADRAVAIDPQNARASAMLGFVNLVRLDAPQAVSAFLDAVSLAPGDPLPRLGLGLAVIRQGRLIEGREHIEVAASLDPGNALVRSYLGKAYSEERQSKDASEQFALAKRLDPQDPTPWFYAALLEQALNRPADAFDNINRARELNDNRLIYQSRLLVDKSAAAGTLSLAGIYTDLGFEQPAINESTRSIAIDPGNYSAYRLLADSYTDRERHESARRNVLFQAALLQPLTINPVQPYTQESDLIILPGTNPVQPAVNEYSPLFDQQGFQLAGSLAAGNQDTLGNNLVFSGLHDRFSYSLGQFHYQTDGFRSNNDIEHNIYHGFVQAQLNPGFHLQAEIRTRRTEQGDITFNRNVDDFSTDLRIDSESESPRLGLRVKPTPESLLMMSVEAIDSLEETSQTDDIFLVADEADVNGMQGSARYIHQTAGINQAIGVDAYDISNQRSATLTMPDGMVLPFDAGDGDSRFTSVHYYTDGHAHPDLRWTLGLNYSRIDDALLQLDDHSLDPKLGVRWFVNNDNEIRLALNRGRKLNRAADRTLEPTILAGFNQLYDDIGGTTFVAAGIGYDRNTGDSVRTGIELQHRQLEVPRLVQTDTESPELSNIGEDQQETSIRGYWNRIVDANLSVGIDVLYERFERDGIFNNSGQQIIEQPTKIETLTLPISVNLTRSSGFFANGKLSVVQQSVDSPDGEQSRSRDSRFAVAEAGIGYRLASLRNVRATLRLDVYNLTDEKLKFQDHNIQSSRINSPRFTPGRSVVGRVSFLF